MNYVIMALPVLALIWLVISIIMFCITNKEDIEKGKSWKKQIIISAAIIGAWFLIIGGFILLILSSIIVVGM
ncbi:hypothetical protein [Treponema sp.]|uniref:hypothetical protein n=1 Tax=Treponema sp. TaxID=166 RepID=UPI00298E5B3E|nr:hypothetical protein [Treponema sp.]MCR5612721.1 hypothetical protein [Treponema sp.]